MMSLSKKLLLLSAACFALSSQTEIFAEQGVKAPFLIKRGDCELVIGGKTKIESYYEDNAYLLNKNIPDENEYFKHTIDINLDAAYGKEKYGYKAVEMYVDLRHKGIWGKALSFSDRDSGPIGPSNVKFGTNVDAVFGGHTHTPGKTLIWFQDAWLRFSMNSVFGSQDNRNLHFFKLGWFPFDMGRGIAFGSAYGLNKELLGLYSYVEDKSAPGINLHGVIVKDCLEYDVYYSKFEERSKSLSDTINLEKRHIVGSAPWRGINKDDEVIAARLQWTALQNECYGELDFEPYFFYNAASDQKIEIAPDSKANWGSYGLLVEHEIGDFEWGGEVAFNYGKQKAFKIDRNRSQIVNQNGQLVEQHTHILNGDPSLPTSVPVLVTDVTRGIAKQPNYDNSTEIAPGYFNAKNRFRPAYTNKYDGWMAVVDAAYKLRDWNLKFAVAYGYASGDTPPNATEKDKTYHGFIGLHEVYSGKRVISVFLLDQRLTKIPVGLDPNVFEGQKIKAAEDTSFSDIQHVGFGMTWTPKCRVKNLSINPNILAFWKASSENKININHTTGAISLSDQKASKFMGTELNFIASCALSKDLKFFANGAVFLPGQYFTDVAGVPVGKDVFDEIVKDDRNDLIDASLFRLSDDTAFHLNLGIEFKF